MNTKAVSLLIVDDDPVFAQLVRQMILSLGSEFACTTHWAASGEQAMAELQHGNYDLVLLDYHLPGVNGLQLLTTIRSLPERQPAVIMLTGSGNEAVAVEAMKLGARDYLAKAHLDIPPLLRALRSALAQKQLADQIASYNAQARADLEMAQHLQHSLLPDSYPSFPASVSTTESALRFCHRFCPASELAGDFFSVFRVSETQAGVFLCDVMGHGVRSALVTAMVRALVDNSSGYAADTGQFLTELNRRLTGLLRPSQGPMFATAFYLVADSATGRLSYATAGHPPALHLHRRAGSVSPLRLPSPAGPALGLFAQARYGSGESLLAENDVLLLFTDGLFEAINPENEEEYGQDRLVTAVKHHMQLAPADLCDALIGEVRAFTQGAPLSDDVCLLSVEVAHLQAGVIRCPRPS